MTDTPAIRFPSPELARKIAEIHGKKVQIITVKMRGKKDVAEFLAKLKAARGVRPSSTFRVKTLTIFKISFQIPQNLTITALNHHFL